MFHLLYIFHSQLVVFLDVEVATFSHLFFRESRLNTQAFVHLCFEDSEFVELCLFAHTEFSVTVGTVLQSKPEVWKFRNDFRIVPYGTSDISGILQQECAVEECHEVIGLQVEHEVKVEDGLVVISHLCPQESSVVVCEEVVGIEVERSIIVCHGSPEVIEVESGNGSVHIAIHSFGHEVDGFAEILVALFPLMPCHADDGFLTPQRTVVWVDSNTFIECDNSFCGVFLEHIDLCLHGIDFRVLAPSGEHGVYLCQCHIILFLLNMTKHSVVPQISVLRVVFQCFIVVFHGSGKVVLSDAAESSEFIDADHKRVSVKCLGTVVFSSLVVVEIEFRQTSVEPWFVEIRFCRDHLIEILYGEHIVFIVECRLSYHEQSVGIKLCLAGH